MSDLIDPANSFLQRLSPGLFWDVDRDGVDPRQHQRFLIARVMDYGTREDARLTEAFYGDGEILKCLQQSRSLHRKTLAYFSELFQVPRDSFRAWKTISEGTWNQ